MLTQEQIKALNYLNDCGLGVDGVYLRKHVNNARGVVISIDYPFYPKDKIINCLNNALKYKTYPNMEIYITEAIYYIEHLYEL